VVRELLGRYFDFTFYTSGALTRARTDPRDRRSICQRSGAKEWQDALALHKEQGEKAWKQIYVESSTLSHSGRAAYL
jgi:hypothetical protein